MAAAQVGGSGPGRHNLAHKSSGAHDPCDAVSDDLVELDEVTDQSVLEALRARFEQGSIYTMAAGLLVAMNPFEEVQWDGQPIYSEAMMRKYAAVDEYVAGHLPRNHLRELISNRQPANRPHVYEMAVRAYEAALQGKPQSILLSGISGAGKTESAKLMMQFLTHVHRFRHKRTARPSKLVRSNSLVLGVVDPAFARHELSELSARVTDTNPIVEAFAHSKTMNNNNSTRVCRHTEFLFSESQGELSGARIRCLYLDKSRLSVHTNSECAFHVFYYMCLGMTEAERTEFNMESELEEYALLTHSHHAGRIEGVNEQHAWITLLEALHVVGFSDSDCAKIWSVLSGILRLGNVMLDGNADVAAVRDPQVLQQVADQLGLDMQRLEKSLTRKAFPIGKKMSYVDLPAAEAVTRQHGLAAELYQRVFQWVIDRCNQNIAPGSDARIASARASSRNRAREEEHKTAGDEGVAGENNDNDDDGDDQSVTTIATTTTTATTATPTTGAGAVTAAAPAVFRSVSVLDMYGFEVLTENGLPQLCINFANEKFHEFFLRSTFHEEQLLLRDECVDYTPTDFADNEQVMSLIAHPENGIFTVVTNQMLSKLQSSDEGVLAEIRKQCGRQKEFVPPPNSMRRFCFGVAHTVHNVIYDVRGFAEHNRDRITDQLEQVARDSTVEFVADLFPPPPTALHNEVAAAAAGGESRGSSDSTSPPRGAAAGGSRGRRGSRASIDAGTGDSGVRRGSALQNLKRQKTEGFLTFRFQKHMQELVEKLQLTECLFIRCIKSSTRAAPGYVEDALVRQQLRSLSVVDWVHAKQQLFVAHVPFGAFVERFRCIADRNVDREVTEVAARSIPGSSCGDGSGGGSSTTTTATDVFATLSANAAEASMHSIPAQREACQQLTRHLIERVPSYVPSDLWALVEPSRDCQYGLTRVFLRKPLMRALYNMWDRKILEYRAHAVRVQSNFRSFRCWKLFRIQRAAIVSLQSGARMFPAMWHLARHRAAAITVQSVMRMNMLYLGLRFLRTVVITLQRWWRSVVGRVKFRHFCRVIRVVRARARAVGMRRHVQVCCRSCIKIQRAYRTHRRIERLKEAKSIVQRAVRRYHTYHTFCLENPEIRDFLSERRDIRWMRRIVRRLRSWMHTRTQRRWFLTLRRAAIRLQRRLRCYIAHRRISRLVWACKKVQGHVRRIRARRKIMSARRSVQQIEARFIVRLHVRRLQAMRSAAQRIQRSWRTVVYRKRFVRLRLAARVVQNWVRGLFSVRKLQEVVSQAMIEREVSAERREEVSYLVKFVRLQHPDLGLFELDVAASLSEFYGPHGWVRSILALPDQLIDVATPNGELEQLASVHIGMAHTTVLTISGRVLSRGCNERGQLGVGHFDDCADWAWVQPWAVSPSVQQGGQQRNNERDPHIGFVPLVPAIVSLSVGEHHTVAMTDDGGVLSWGSNRRGQLGQGHFVDTPHPTPVTWFLQKSIRLTAVRAAQSHSVALSDRGTVFTWGAGNCLGQGVFVGNGDQTTPQRVDALEMHRVKQVEVGASFTCVLTMAGEVFCWGNNKFGQCGSSAGGFQYTSSSGRNSCNHNRGGSGGGNGSSKHGQRQAGDNIGCAFGSSSSAGHDSGGAGDRSMSWLTAPNSARWIEEESRAIAHNRAAASDSKSGGGVDSNIASGGKGGQEQDRRQSSRKSQGILLPTRVKSLSDYIAAQNAPGAGAITGSVGISSIACGGYHAAAITSQGVLFAWGRNDNGQLGQSKFRGLGGGDLVRPLADTPVRYVVCGYRQTFAMTADGVLYGFGRLNCTFESSDTAGKDIEWRYQVPFSTLPPVADEQKEEMSKQMAQRAAAAAAETQTTVNPLLVASPSPAASIRHSSDTDTVDSCRDSESGAGAGEDKSALDVFQRVRDDPTVRRKFAPTNRNGGAPPGYIRLKDGSLVSEGRSDRRSLLRVFSAWSSTMSAFFFLPISSRRVLVPTRRVLFEDETTMQPMSEPWRHCGALPAAEDGGGLARTRSAQKSILASYAQSATTKSPSSSSPRATGTAASGKESPPHGRRRRGSRFTESQASITSEHLGSGSVSSASRSHRSSVSSTRQQQGKGWTSGSRVEAASRSRYGASLAYAVSGASTRQRAVHSTHAALNVGDSQRGIGSPKARGRSQSRGSENGGGTSPSAASIGSARSDNTRGSARSMRKETLRASGTRRHRQQKSARTATSPAQSSATSGGPLSPSASLDTSQVRTPPQGHVSSTREALDFALELPLVPPVPDSLVPRAESIVTGWSYVQPAVQEEGLDQHLLAHIPKYTGANLQVSTTNPLMAAAAEAGSYGAGVADYDERSLASGSRRSVGDGTTRGGGTAVFSLAAQEARNKRLMADLGLTQREIDIMYRVTDARSEYVAKSASAAERVREERKATEQKQDEHLTAQMQQLRQSRIEQRQAAVRAWRRAREGGVRASQLRMHFDRRVLMRSLQLNRLLQMDRFEREHLQLRGSMAALADWLRAAQSSGGEDGSDWGSTVTGSTFPSIMTMSVAHRPSGWGRTALAEESEVDATVHAKKMARQRLAASVRRTKTCKDLKRREEQRKSHTEHLISGDEYGDEFDVSTGGGGGNSRDYHRSTSGRSHDSTQHQQLQQQQQQHSHRHRHAPHYHRPQTRQPQQQQHQQERRRRRSSRTDQASMSSSWDILQSISDSMSEHAPATSLLHGKELAELADEHRLAKERSRASRRAAAVRRERSRSIIVLSAGDEKRRERMEQDMGDRVAEADGSPLLSTPKAPQQQAGMPRRSSIAVSRSNVDNEFDAVAARGNSRDLAPKARRHAWEADPSRSRAESYEDRRGLEHKVMDLRMQVEQARSYKQSLIKFAQEAVHKQTAT